MRKFVQTFVILMLVGCSATTTQEQLTRLGPDVLFERALTYLQNRKWDDAITAFDQFSLQYPTHPRVQEARFHLAEAYFGKKEYITASNEFSRLANDYPAGPYADDSRFKVCESYYRLSPKTPLDQQYTRAAFDHCQSLIAYYPQSEFVARAQEISSEMRNKLAQKEYDGGEFYFKRNAFDSAIIYYDVTVRDYPDTVFAPRALLRLVQTYEALGYKEEMEEARARLLKDYPNSPEAKGLQQPAPVPNS